MIDFIFAGVAIIAVMFVVFFILSFVTIGLTYAFARFAKGFIDRVRAPHPVLE